MFNSTIAQQQANQLRALLLYARNTRYGRRYHFSTIRNYEEFAQRVPLVVYADIEQAIEEIKRGVPDVLWPGRTDKFAVSSGTTGKGKHLPVSAERLNSDKLFLRSAAKSMLMHSPNPLALFGAHLSIPGGLESQSYHGNPIELGEISGFLAKYAPRAVHLIQGLDVPSLTGLAWQEKYNEVLKYACTHSIHCITGVPSWIWKLCYDVSQRTNCSDLTQLWPNLHHLFTGGVALSGYKEAINTFFPNQTLYYLESYGASEGYIAHNPYPNADLLQLKYDNGLFFEFEDVLTGHIGDCTTIQNSRSYYVIISSNAGLWRYQMNDIITVDDAEKGLIRVTGRKNLMLDTYGEAVSSTDVEQLEATLKANYPIHQLVATYNTWNYKQAAPQLVFYVISLDKDAKNILINLSHQLQSDIDNGLRRLNRHYAIRRESSAMMMCSIEYFTLEECMQHMQFGRAQQKIPAIWHV